LKIPQVIDVLTIVKVDVSPPARSQSNLWHAELQQRQQAARAAIDADERTVRALQTEIDATEQQLAALLALSTLETMPPTSASLTTCRQR